MRNKSTSAPSACARIVGAIAASAALVGCWWLAYGLHLPWQVALPLITCGALVLACQQTSAELMGTARREGALGVLLLGATIETIANAVDELIAGAAALAASGAANLIETTFVRVMAQVQVHLITTRRELLAALVRAHLRAVSANLTPRLLPAPRAAAHIPRAA